MKASAIIPALNEEGAIGSVVSSIDRCWISEVIVADNGSTDKTAQAALKAGARVVSEPRKGYGWACLAGMAEARETDVVLFLDGDGSDDTSLIGRLLAPIFEGKADMVIGSRVLGDCETGALTPPQRFGNWLSSRLVNLIFGTQFTDLGPFRAIRKETLDKMRMSAKTYGWTVEMQIKAAALKLRILEVPVNCRRRRAGKSKVSGTVKGTFLAGSYILFHIFKAIISIGLFNRRGPHVR